MKFNLVTGKSLSEALLFAEHGENMLCTKIVLNVRNNFCTQHVLPGFELGIFMYWTCNSMNNLLSYCGLVDAKIRASNKDLPVHKYVQKIFTWSFDYDSNIYPGICMVEHIYQSWWKQDFQLKTPQIAFHWKLCL